MALACDLTNSWPSEVREHSQTEQILAAALQARLYNEQAKQFR